MTFSLLSILPLARATTYQFTFEGLLDEESGLEYDPSVRAVDVTAYFATTSSLPSESFTVNGTYVYNASALPLYFKFDVGSTDREWWVTSDDTNTTIQIFNATLSSYVIQFNDLTGILNTYPIIEVQRNINGSEVTVEKRHVDSAGKIYASLVYGETYSILIGDGSTTFSYGDVLFENDALVELPLRGLEFPDTIQIGYKYVKVYATRDSDNNIYISYLDSLEDSRGNTTSVIFRVYYQSNSTLAYENSAGEVDSWSDTWTGGNNETDYFCIVTITHELFGDMDYRQVLPRLYGAASPWSLAVLGSLPFDTSYLIPTFIILCVAAAVSAFNSHIGLFLVIILACLFAWWGWLPISADILVFGFALVIIFAIVLLKRRTVTY